MDLAEFKTRAFAVVGGHEGWRQRIARRLEINDRTVRRWVSDDSVPDWVAERLPQVDGAWIVGDGITEDGVSRLFVVHVGWPAFVAWVPSGRPDDLRVVIWMDIVDAATKEEWCQLAIERLKREEELNGRGEDYPAASSAAGAGGGPG